MKAQKAYKYRFYPTKEQVENLAQTFGSVRYVYNYMLRLRTDAFYNHGEKVDYHDTAFLLTHLKHNGEASWLNNVPAVPLQQGLRNLQRAFLNFWASHARYPKFKKKHNKQSAIYTSNAFKWDGRDLTLAKQKEPLNIRWSRQFSGEPSSVTVSKDAAERYFVSILVTEDITPKEPTNKQVGIDLGIKDTVVASDGFRSGSPQYTRKYEKKLAKAQRELSKKKKGSKNRKKARLKVARIHAKIKDSRTDFLHKLSTELINENQVIAVETLGIKNMAKNSCLSKSIHDAGWGELLRQLEYKADWYGRELISINRWFPSSKRCFDCGYINNNLKLSDREWICETCGVVHDRDLNASCNTLAAGQAVTAFGEDVSLVSRAGIS